MRHKPLVLILGRTGSGKDTLASHLPLSQLKSYTTRPRRTNELDTHTFVDEDFYKSCTDIIAETTINGYHYFCTKDQLNSSDLYIIDPIGQRILNDAYPGLSTVAIYISAPYSLRRNRALTQRGDDLAAFTSRNDSEYAQFTQYEQDHGYDYIVENRNLEASLAQLNAILKYEGVIS